MLEGLTIATSLTLTVMILFLILHSFWYG